jgi:GT2 family glycosyltransferase
VHILQKVGCTSKTEAGSIIAGALRFEDDCLVGTAGHFVTFDGIFGAFFDGYWRRHTSIRDLALVLEFTGRVQITVDRVGPSETRVNRIVDVESQGAGKRLIIPVPLADDAETRLVLNLRLIDDSEVMVLAWATTTAPRRPVTLNAVICTYNREEDVAATLEELLGKATGLHRVLVVNQGEIGLANRFHHLRNARQAGLLQVCDQRNLGGAGGFGRGMLDSLSDEGCSHLLLMDDDIDLDADTIRRLIIILSYLDEDHAVGGAMIDRHSRTRLFSVGDVLDRKKPEIRNLVDPAANDITQEATSRYLARDHRPDFNGWWFFAFSKEQVQRQGLPLPLFIRGDDVEYGYRLTISGTRTLAWPGLAVWHEPFHTKRQPWHYFYDRRNSLFLCEAHGRLGRLRLAGALITGFLNHLLRFDYDRAACITLGLKAFNDGAETLCDWSGADHARLAKTFATREFDAVNNIGPSPASISRIPMPMLYLARLAHDLFRRSDAPTRPTVIDSREWRPAVQRRPRHVRVYYAESGTMADFVHDSRQTRRCTQRFATEFFRFLRRRWRPDRLKRLTYPDFWSSYTPQRVPNSRRTR